MKDIVDMILNHKPEKHTEYYAHQKPHHSAKGEKNTNCKLTKDDVLEIRRLFATGDYTKSQLAKQYKVHLSTIHTIVIKTRWEHI